MKTNLVPVGFHNIRDARVQELAPTPERVSSGLGYRFENFFHPFVGELIRKLNSPSLTGMLDAKYHQSLTREFFTHFYVPSTSTAPPVQIHHSPKEIDVAAGGPYANYNWELLFHIPLTIAVHLSKNQRFAEAQRWFHYIFNPTSNDTSLKESERFWNFLAFRNDDKMQIDELLALLSKPDSECTADELQLKHNVLSGYEAIKRKPFQPHAVARTRHLAYRYSVVMKYLDNLIAWGDSLFRQDTTESINEATQRYVLAANILGPRPQHIPSSGKVRPKTFAQLRSEGMDQLGNALVELEAQFPFNLGLPHTQGTNPTAPEPLFGIGRTLYFCIPRNEKLLGYWDTVSDRLFKVRHCMNIEGVVRQLALFDPPIDPGMMVKAAAAGINIGSIVSGLNQPLSPVRGLFMIQKALELAAEVRGMGNALLSALEKGDGERIALLRQGHEIKIQQMQKEVRFFQWKQAQEATESLIRSRSSAIEEYRYYQRLLGLPPDTETVPDTLSPDRPELTEENFDEVYGSLIGQYDKSLTLQAYSQLKLEEDPSPAVGKGNLRLNASEDADLNKHSPKVRDYQTYAFGLKQIAPSLALIPPFTTNFHFWGVGGTIKLGGEALTANVLTAAEILELLASREGHDAASASKTGSFERRADEWILKSNSAARELMRIGRQIISSLIAEQIAHREYLNIQKQIEQSEETDRFLHEKFTNEELYSWMQGELSRLYYEYYRFAFDTARRAEQAMKRELMRPELDNTDFIKFNYWDSGRKGLLSGEALYLDLKRMEMAYHENNKREFELTRHVSLRQLNPAALLALKATGTCEVTVPEWLFDLDNPGHYMRRLKNVSLSIPSVAGPYTNVGCTLSLGDSWIRKSPLGEDYERGKNDNRFVHYSGTIQSIVTSTGNNDAGMFETNLRDERFLPFEGAGAESTWKLELPSDFRQFDYDTISDVILHIRYTARQDGALREKAITYLRDVVLPTGKAELALLFSLKHDFPTQWHRFVSGNDQSFTAIVKQDHFPYFTQSKTITVKEFQVYTFKDGTISGPQNSEVELSAFNEKLNGTEASAEFKLPSTSLDKHANVFIVLKYSVG